ncbi:zinc finger MYM-type protein 1 [Trichonephila clavipes]|nr:zinc finger MYM-type protein 1 [Trichonephila clavipes]
MGNELSQRNSETQQANIKEENMQDLDDQQPSEKDIVQPEDILPNQTVFRKCLAFRGTEEICGSPHNGNFMGALELLAEFGAFIREHIKQRGLRPKSLISYLSKTIYEQIIEIMGKHKSQVNNDDAKYYSIVMDSTPDLSHNGQLYYGIVLGKFFMQDLSH